MFLKNFTLNMWLQRIVQETHANCYFFFFFDLFSKEIIKPTKCQRDFLKKFEWNILGLQIFAKGSRNTTYLKKIVAIVL